MRQLYHYGGEKTLNDSGGIESGDNPKKRGTNTPQRGRFYSNIMKVFRLKECLRKERASFKARITERKNRLKITN